MARFRFPQERTSFTYQGDLKPILAPPRTAVVVYLDQACTLPADIQTEAGISIANSTIFLDQGILPIFLGPAGNVEQLWARVSGGTGPGWAFDAMVRDQIAQFQTFADYPEHIQADAASIWSFIHNLGYHPLVFQVEESTGDIIGGFGIAHITTDRTDLFFGSAMSGKARAK